MHGSQAVRRAPPVLDLPPVIGHLGAAALAPENTLAGLRRAHTAGCRWVEFDVRLTAEGELVLFHDDRLERTTDGRGRVGAASVAVLRQCDAGAWFDRSFAGEPVPTLSEALAELAALGLGANIELKAERGRAAETGMAAADLLARAWPQALPPPLVSSFATAAIAAVQARAPELARGLLMRAVTGNWRRKAEALGCATVIVDHRLLRQASVAEIRKAGYPLLAHTVNDAMRARELFGWGVSSVFSDVPHMILAAAPSGAGRPVGEAEPASAIAAQPGAIS